MLSPDDPIIQQQIDDIRRDVEGKEKTSIRQQVSPPPIETEVGSHEVCLFSSVPCSLVGSYSTGHSSVSSSCSVSRSLYLRFSILVDLKHSTGQQWTGTNSINYYAPQIFAQLGISGMLKNSVSALPLTNQKFNYRSK